MSKAGWLGLVIVTLQNQGFSKKRINEIIRKIEKLLLSADQLELEKIYQKLTKKRKEKQNAN